MHLLFLFKPARRARGGFTLIELLVVVLIIGLLAAAALPQYNVAVAKSRVGKMMSLVRAVADAQERYYMANAKYAMYFEDLDVGIAKPKTINPGTGEWGELALYEDKTQLRVVSEGRYVLGNAVLSDGSVVMYGRRLSDHPALSKYPNHCVSSKGDNLAAKVCKSLGGKQYLENDGYTYYEL